MTTDVQAAGTDTTQAGEQDTPVAASQADAALAAADAGKTATELSDSKAADGKAPEAKPDEAKLDDSKPITYAFKAPEGVTLDEARVAEFTAFAQEHKLAPDVAQKLVDMAAQAEVSGMQARIAQANAWADEVKADKTLGGDKLPESVAIAKKALELGPPELRDLLNTTGLGNHPAVFKWAHAIGMALSVDRFVVGAAPDGETKTMADRLYGAAKH